MTSASSRPGPTLSLVVPVYRSSETLEDLVARLAAVLPSCSSRFEILLVDDGSPDDSWRVISALAERHDYVRGLRMFRNFGQHAAVLCGVRSARFDVVVTMDDDLQHPPEEIPKLLARLDEGFDVVYGIPPELPHSRIRNFSSRLVKRVMAALFGMPSIRQIDAFRALRTSVRGGFAGFNTPKPMFDVLLAWATSNVSAVPVRHDPRRVGKSGYTFRKLVTQALLMVTGFSTAPLRFASLVGFGFTVLGLAVFVYVVVRYLGEGSLPGFPFLASIITVFGGAQLFAIGIIGEYLARMFERTLDRPAYYLRETCGKGE